MKRPKRRLTGCFIGAVSTAIVLAVGGSGCGDNSNVQGTAANEQKGSSASQDPRASFEAFMQSYMKNLQITMEERNEEWKKKGIPPNTFYPSKTKYDVQKSDSLVTPYKGIITYEDSGAGVRTLTFGYHNGKWEPLGVLNFKGIPDEFYDCESKAYRNTAQ
jgi:hypothetical protein